MPLAAALLAAKTLYLACLSVVVVANAFSHAGAAEGVRRLAETGSLITGAFTTWDADAYLELSERGYRSGDPTCMFYPFYPIAIRWLAYVSGWSHLVAGLVLANLCSVAGWCLYHELVRRQWGAEVARWALLALVAFPGSLFYQFIYTESLFLLLVMGLCWGLRQRHLGLAWACGFLLPLTRAVGFLCVVPVLWHCTAVAPPQWLRRLRSRVASFPALLKGKIRGRRGAIQAGSVHPPRAAASNVGSVSSNAVVQSGVWALGLAPVLGLSAYLALMWVWTGSPFEGFALQEAWGIHSIAKLWDGPKFLVGLLTPTAWHAFTGSLLDRCVFLLFASSLPRLWQLDKGLFLWAWVLGVVPAMSGTFTSYTRFASVAFPMFIALAVFLSKPERRLWRFATLGGFAVLHVVLVWQFVNFRWAG